MYAMRFLTIVLFLGFFLIGPVVASTITPQTILKLSKILESQPSVVINDQRGSPFYANQVAVANSVRDIKKLASKIHTLYFTQQNNPKIMHKRLCIEEANKLATMISSHIRMIDFELERMDWKAEEMKNIPYTQSKNLVVVIKKACNHRKK